MKTASWVRSYTQRPGAPREPVVTREQVRELGWKLPKLPKLPKPPKHRRSVAPDYPSRARQVSQHTAGRHRSRGRLTTVTLTCCTSVVGPSPALTTWRKL